MKDDANTVKKGDVTQAVEAPKYEVPRPPTFWERYRRKPQGMVGLVIVLVYVAVALFAPVIAPYDPMNDLYLADSLAAPAWLGKVNANYKDYPVTTKRVIGLKEWKVTDKGDASIETRTIEESAWTVISIPPQESGTVDTQGEDVWESLYGPAEPETDGPNVAFTYDFAYKYAPPQTFSIGFDFNVEAPDDAATKMQIELVAPDGERFDIWDQTIYGSLKGGKAIADARDLDLKMRMGMSMFDEPAQTIFEDKGKYQLVMTASAVSTSGPVEVSFSPVKFDILGMLFGVLGTDHMGSDLWSQLVYGTRLALEIGLSAAFISIAIGTAVGIISGYLGGVVDEIMMRIADVMMSIPDLPVLIVLGALLGKSVKNVVILVALFAWMGTARIVRSQTLSLKERTFVEAAKASGASDWYIMAAHILPNVMPLVFANLVLRIPSAILTEASLSFLGLGDPRVPTWGRMLQNARQFGAFTTLAWWWLIPPGIALTLLSLAFVFIGNTVNEILNPTYRERS